MKRSKIEQLFRRIIYLLIKNYRWRQDPRNADMVKYIDLYTLNTKI